MTHNEMRKIRELYLEIEDNFFNQIAAKRYPEEWADNKTYHLENDIYDAMLQLRVYLKTLADNR